VMAMPISTEGVSVSLGCIESSQYTIDFRAVSTLESLPVGQLAR